MSKRRRLTLDEDNQGYLRLMRELHPDEHHRIVVMREGRSDCRHSRTWSVMSCFAPSHIPHDSLECRSKTCRRRVGVLSQDDRATYSDAIREGRKMTLGAP